ncbi:MAG TPA: Mov34/MPN/PAD-1 family protein [Planctomycetota bacterium]|jgi:proteasome lid subunit RPN8/RPN11
MVSDIDYRKSSKSDVSEGHFPTQASSEYRVHITESAYARMRKHAETTNEVELGGVLIGTVHRDSAGLFLLITGVIEGQNANNYGAQVTFTHQTWEHINKTKDKEYPNQRIVGWYHTHPGFGVFLSGMDTFIQENYFNHPYQVAIVIETRQNKEGCFAWINGKTAALRRYWVGDREIALAAGEAEAFDPAPTSEVGSRERSPDAGPVSGRSAAPGVTSLMFMVLLFVCGLLVGKIWVIGELRNTALASLQSEIYSVMEFAALNVAAGNDMAETNEKLMAIGDKLKKGEQASQDIKELSEHLAALSHAYDQKRSTFRANLARIMETKQALTDRVDATSRRQDELGFFVAQIYVMRVLDALTKDGTTIDPEQLGAKERLVLRKYIEAAMRLAPDVKAQIEQLSPRLLPALFSDSTGTRKVEDVAPKGDQK